MVKLLWLGSINIEDKQARERAARQWADKRSASPHAWLWASGSWTGEALNDLDTAYPGHLKYQFSKVSQKSLHRGTDPTLREIS